jgi:hypothetical protein
MVLFQFAGSFALLMLTSLMQQMAGHLFAPSRHSEPQRPQGGKAHEKDDKGISPTAAFVAMVITAALGRAPSPCAIGHDGRSEFACRQRANC